jgi:Flp pilus assembly protein TadD
VRYLGVMRWMALLALAVSAPPIGAFQAETTESTGLLGRVELQIKANQFLRAETLLRQALVKEPSNTDVLFRLGYVEYRQRKLTEARAHFSSVVKLAPPAYNSRYFLGRIALLENKSKEAVTWLEPVVSSGQTGFDANSQLAKAYADAGEPGKAARVLKSAIAETPWDGALHYRLGRLYTQAGEKELAKDAFETSVRLKSASREDVEILMRTSQLIAEGNKAQAIEHGARILDRARVDPDSLVALGIVYASSSISEEALRAFERAAGLDPNLFQAHFNQGLALLKTGRAKDAIEPLKHAFQLLPQSPEAAMTLGLAQVMNQNYAEAVAPLEVAWKTDTANARLGALLGTAYLRSGAAGKAVPVLRVVANLKKDDPAARLLLIEALDTSGDPAHALQLATEAKSQFSASPEIQMLAAQQFVKAGNYEEARAAFEHVLALKPGQPEAELGLADSLQKSGEHEPAILHYRAAGSSLLARLGEARSLVALRRLEEARKVLEDALPENPAEVSLRVELARVYARLGMSSLASEQTRIVEGLRTRTQ